MTNFDLSLNIFTFLKQAGVETLVVCAGARNAPLIYGLKEQNFKVFNFFEERSAAFFALGLIKSTKKPVAVLTTSGTAAAELLPAAVEATYQGLPLILITADRPKRYRGTGSPQTIDQVGLYSSYVEAVYDFDIHSKNFNFKWTRKKPLQLNVSFDEPLIDHKSDSSSEVKLELLDFGKIGATSASEIRNPLIIVGEIEAKHKDKVINFIITTKAPVYAESLSQIKHFPEVEPYLIQSPEQIFKLKLCDSVLRIGGVPTLRFWRDLEEKYKNVPVVNYTDLPYSGLARDSGICYISQLEFHAEFPQDRWVQIKQQNSELQRKKESLLRKYPLSEQSFTRKLSEVIQNKSLYLGNSLPIRNWDEFAKCGSIHVSANRGANGIDGQIATYLGWSETESKSFCYIGDLTALYDLAAPGLTPQLKSKNQRNIIILNNFGGQIFSRVFKNKEFINAHTTQFQHWAKMWEWDYLQIANPEDSLKVSALQTPFNIIEILPNAEQTDMFWIEWDKLCQLI